MTQGTSLFFDLPCVVYAVFPDKNTAEALASKLVDQGLAACANVFQEHTAIYVWAGKLERSAEVAVLFKTTPAAVPRLIEEIKSQHPYETPAILSWQIAHCDPSYAKWISESVKS